MIEKGNLMRAAFRTDASNLIGTGHVMRCFTLAEALKKHDVEVVFFCRRIPEQIQDTLQDHGHQVKLLPKPEGQPFVEQCEGNWLGVPWAIDAEQLIESIEGKAFDWLIVDHYGIDSQWHQRLRPYVGKIMVIDDLADRPLDCDLLLDQNFYLDPFERFSKLVSNGCAQLLGPHYALLRSEFITAKIEGQLYKNHDLKRVLVFMGGGDSTNETKKVICALDAFDTDKLHVDVVVGASNFHAESVRKLCDQRCWTTFHQNTPHMALLISSADLAIGTGGVAALERCFLGIPSIVMIIAKNQLDTTLDMDRAGALKCIGWNSKVDSQDILKELHLLSNKDILSEMSKNAFSLFGEGTYEGVEGVIRHMGIK